MGATVRAAAAAVWEELPILCVIPPRSAHVQGDLQGPCDVRDVTHLQSLGPAVGYVIKASTAERQCSDLF